MDFRGWINAKTVDTLHIALKTQPGTIRVWRHRNYIPRNIWPRILGKYPEIGLTDLLDWEAVAGRSDADA